MRQLSKIQTLVLQCSALVMCLAALAFMGSMLMPHDTLSSAFHLQLGCEAVIFTAASVTFAYIMLLASYEGNNLVILRLRRQQMFGCVCFVLCGVCMAMQAFQFGFARRNEWVLCLLIGAVITLYTQLRLGSELKKENDPKI